MPRTTPPLSVLLAPVEYIAGMWLFHREPGPPTYAFSTPGHLFHCMVRGSYHLTTNGRSYRVRAGDIVYYHGNESVTCRWDDSVVEMYSLALHAPALAPLPLDRRVFRAGRTAYQLFPRIHEEYSAPSGDPARLSLFALVHELLLAVGMLPVGGLRSAGDKVSVASWDDVEAALRSERQFRATVGEMCAIAHCSRATLNRLCRGATGMSPQERLRVMRMEEARGLLLYSPLSLSDIAHELGFSRQHEFTREFSHHFRRPPSSYRQHPAV